MTVLLNSIQNRFYFVIHSWPFLVQFLWLQHLVISQLPQFNNPPGFKLSPQCIIFLYAFNSSLLSLLKIPLLRSLFLEVLVPVMFSKVFQVPAKLIAIFPFLWWWEWRSWWIWAGIGNDKAILPHRKRAVSWTIRVLKAENTADGAPMIWDEEWQQQQQHRGGAPDVCVKLLSGLSDV